MRWQFPVSSGLGQTSLVGHHFRHGIIGSHGTEPLSDNHVFVGRLRNAKLGIRIVMKHCIG